MKRHEVDYRCCPGCGTTELTRHGRMCRLCRAADRDLPPDADWRQDIATFIWEREPAYDPLRGDRESWEIEVDRIAARHANRERRRFRRGSLPPLKIPPEPSAPDEHALLLAAEELECRLRERIRIGGLSHSARIQLCETLRRIADLADSRQVTSDFL